MSHVTLIPFNVVQSSTELSLKLEAQNSVGIGINPTGRQNYWNAIQTSNTNGILQCFIEKVPISHHKTDNK